MEFCAHEKNSICSDANFATLTSMLAGVLFLKVAKANFYPRNFRVAIQSPINKTYAESAIPLNIETVVEDDFESPERWIGYSLDGQETVSMPPHIYEWNNMGTFVANTTLKGLPNGQHRLTVYAENRYNSTKMRNITLSSQSTVYFTVNATPTDDEPFRGDVPVQPSIPEDIIYGIIVATSVAVVCLGLLVYFKKRKR